MKNSLSISPMNEGDRVPVIDIFNYYIEHSFAAYPQEKVSYEAYQLFLSFLTKYPGVTLKDEEGRVHGFGFLRAYSPIPTFHHTAEITYFLHPDDCGKGLGEIILNHLLAEAKKRAIKVIVASISSFNEPSIRFHQKHGFKLSGRIDKAGFKNEKYFDVVLMQKNIEDDQS